MINKATDYIEKHISEDIILEEIAKQCHVSYHYFSKTFTMITGYTLKEYIRNRRITLASYEVSNTNQRILDIGIKYGYGSNETFSRAFKRIHGINPSDARKNNVTVYTHFPILNYEIPKQNILSLRYDIIHDIKYKFIGKSINIKDGTNNYDDAQQLQELFLADFITLHPSKETLYRVLYNLSTDYNDDDFFVGFEHQLYDDEVGDLKTIKIQASKAVRFIAKGTTRKLIPKIKLIIFNEWEKNDFDADLIYEMEYVEEQANGTINFYYIVSIK